MVGRHFICFAVTLCIGCTAEQPAIAPVEQYPHARELLVGIKVPDAQNLALDDASDADSPELIRARFEGGHNVWLDRRTGMPTRYLLAGRELPEDPFRYPLPIDRGPLASRQYNHDPLEHTLQDLLGVELASPEAWGFSFGGRYAYLVRGMPSFELSDLEVSYDAQGFIVELKNMLTIEVEQAENKIALQRAKDIAGGLLVKYRNGKTDSNVHALELGYIKTSEVGGRVKVRRAWRVPIGTRDGAFDFYIDAETGQLIDAFRPREGGPKSIRSFFESVKPPVLMDAS